MKIEAHPTASSNASEEQTLQLFLAAVPRRQITRRVAESGETIRVMVLCALDAFRLHFPKEALVDRRRSP